VETVIPESNTKYMNIDPIPYYYEAIDRNAILPANHAKLVGFHNESE